MLCCVGIHHKGVESEDGRSVTFQMSPSCTLHIQLGDITQWFVSGSSADAIVNPANDGMLGGRGADGAIHMAAGPELLDACYEVPEVRRGVRCPTGEARITKGFNLPAAHIIHTVGPIYDRSSNPDEELRNAYRSSLRVAKENNILFIAFPAISCGVYRFPHDKAAKISILTVKEFAKDFQEIHFVLYERNIFQLWLKQARKVL